MLLTCFGFLGGGGGACATRSSLKAIQGEQPGYCPIPPLQKKHIVPLGPQLRRVVRSPMAPSKCKLLSISDPTQITNVNVTWPITNYRAVLFNPQGEWNLGDGRH